MALPPSLITAQAASFAGKPWFHVEITKAWPDFACGFGVLQLNILGKPNKLPTMAEFFRKFLLVKLRTNKNSK